MKKKIWIINHYAIWMLHSKGGRHYWLSENLRKEGYEPVIFCCNINHKNLKNGNQFIEPSSLWGEKVDEDIQTPFVYIRSNTYAGNGIARIKNMIGFYLNLLKVVKEYAAINGKPDIIYASSPHPLDILAGIKIAKHFGVKCIGEVRDLWPEGFIAYGLAGSYNPVVLYLRQLEKEVYKKVDALIFTFEGGYDYIKEQGWDKEIPRSKVHYINNGIDLEQFDYNKQNFRIQDEDLENEDIFKVVYTGSIRHVNNLGKLLDVAKLIKNSKIKFLIWGDGDELFKLKERVKNESIKNVIFKGKVEKKYIPYITSKANLNLAHNNNSPLFRFGISFNKIFDYLASGRPILCDFYAKYNPVLSCRAGVAVDSGNIIDIAKMIDIMSSNHVVELAEYGKNARNGVKEYDFKNLMQKLIDIFNDI